MDTKKTSKRREIYWILVGVGLALALIDIIFVKGSEADLIVKIHYSGYQALHYTFAGVGLACFGIGMVLFFINMLGALKRTKVDLEQEPKPKVVLDTPERVYNYLRTMMAKAEANNPYYVPAAEAAKRAKTLIGQLDEMNEIQARLEELLEVNNITKLDETKDLLQDIENAICMINTRKLINYYVVGGWSAFVAHAEQISEENQELLGQAQGMLDDIVEFVNGGKSLDEVKSRVSGFRKTIQAFVKEESEDEN